MGRGWSGARAAGPARGASWWGALWSAVALAALCGCGRLGFDALAGDGGPDDRLADAGAACSFGPFSAPTQVFESSSADYGPSLSRDGLTLYLSITRSSGFGSTDLWMATRPELGVPFSNLTNLGSDLNTGSSDAEPVIARDDLTLYFETTRGQGRRLWMATRSDPGEAFAPPVLLDATDPALISDASGPTITADGLELYFASDENADRGIWRVTRSSIAEPFGAPEEVVELRASDIWGYPAISPDGLELFYVLSNRSLEIVVARRPDRQSSFSPPEVVDLGDGDESDPELSMDGRTLVYTSNRDGDFDVWAATRECLPRG